MPTRLLRIATVGSARRANRSPKRHEIKALFCSRCSPRLPNQPQNLRHTVPLALYIDPMEQMTAELKGPARIAAYLKTLPDAPGVYRMIDAKGDVLYVGKAKSLKKRVASYADGRPQRAHRAHGGRHREMLFVTTASEIEALLLESNLIKRLKPRYNVSLSGRQILPQHSAARGPPIPAAPEASRRQDASRATISGRSPAPAP